MEAAHLCVEVRIAEVAVARDAERGSVGRRLPRHAAGGHIRLHKGHEEGVGALTVCVCCGVACLC